MISIMFVTLISACNTTGVTTIHARSNTEEPSSLMTHMQKMGRSNQNLENMLDSFKAYISRLSPTDAAHSAASPANDLEDEISAWLQNIDDDNAAIMLYSFLSDNAEGQHDQISRQLAYRRILASNWADVSELPMLCKLFLLADRINDDPRNRGRRRWIDSYAFKQNLAFSICRVLGKPFIPEGAAPQSAISYFARNSRTWLSNIILEEWSSEDNIEKRNSLTICLLLILEQ